LPFFNTLLSHVEIAEHPVIAMSDIVTCDAITHEIKLTEDVYNRMLFLTDRINLSRTYLLSLSVL